MKEHLVLVRATANNQRFNNLKTQWEAQLGEFGESIEKIEEYALPYMEHAEKICAETPPDQNYGIYLLQSEQEHPECEYHALLHANTARLKNTTGVTLRINWILLSPMYDYQDIGSQQMELVTAGVVYGGLDLSSEKMRADHLKIHLQSVGDRKFAVALAHSLQYFEDNVRVAVKGNWLHIDNVPTVGG